jgi:hypothetical protein
VKPRPRWGPLPWFVLVLTLLVILLVALLPPLILDEEPPAWVLRSAARVASWHGDADPIEAEWLETTRAEAARIMEATAGEAEPSPSPTVTAEGDTDLLTGTPSPAATPSASPLEDPGGPVNLVVMRGRFDSAPPGGPPPSEAPERWLVVAYDSVTRVRWRLAVLEKPPVLPDDAASFEF